MFFIISILMLISVSSLISLLILSFPRIKERLKSLRAKDPDSLTRRPEKTSYRIEKKQILFIFISSPIVTAITAVMLFGRSLAGIIIAVLIGLLLPVFWVRGNYARVVRKFEGQLPDTLMILTSCLRGGLSIIQAMEVLVEEMPSPTSQEFSQVLKENKMGIGLEESLRRLNKRINSEDLVLFSSAITVSRETGGDLTEVFSRLHESIRARNKLLENIKTLTLQGRIQSMVLTILPFVFILAIHKINPTYFELMKSSAAGRMLLVLASCLLAVGLFLVRIFSRIEV